VYVEASIRVTRMERDTGTFLSINANYILFISPIPSAMQFFPTTLISSLRIMVEPGQSFVSLEPRQ
jgi:hypothetical protein